MKRTSDEFGDEAQEDEPPNLFQRVGPAQSDLKRSAPDFVPGSETKLQRISAVFETDSLPVTCACVASISTKSGLDVPIEPNVDREEELQALRAAEPRQGFQRHNPSIWPFQWVNPFLAENCTLI